MAEMTPQERAEITREIVAEFNEQQRLEKKAEAEREARLKRKERSKINKDDPWILKFDKWLDKFRPY